MLSVIFNSDVMLSAVIYFLLLTSIRKHGSKKYSKGDTPLSKGKMDPQYVFR